MKVKREMIILACLSVLSVVLVFSCGHKNPEAIGPKGYDVSGRVTDSITTLPIDSVLMSWGDTLFPKLDVYTDSSGEFTLGMPENGRIVYAWKAGFQTKGREIRFSGSDVSNFNFELVSE